MLFLVAVLASALITVECTVVKKDSEEVKLQTSNDWIVLNTQGKYCQDTDVAATHVSPITPEACQSYCKKNHKRFCSYDVGRGQGYCVATDDCTKRIPGSNGARFTVWKRIICADKNQHCLSLAGDCKGDNAAVRDMCPLTCGLCTVDPCMACDIHASCSNGQCTCKTGYKGDGKTCTADPCASCDAHATCKSGKCVCNSGYIGNGYTCKADECSHCDAHASCVKGHCKCKDGYKGNGKTCSFSVQTTDGKDCVFPFTYRGKVYHDCVIEVHAAAGRHPWCSTTSNYHRDMEWGYCAGKRYTGTYDRGHGGSGGRWFGGGGRRWFGYRNGRPVHTGWHGHGNHVDSGWGGHHGDGIDWD